MATANQPILVVEFDEPVPFKEAKRHFEATYVAFCLLSTGGNMSEAAQIAGKDRKDFYDLAKRCGVNPSDFRA